MTCIGVRRFNTKILNTECELSTLNYNINVPISEMLRNFLVNLECTLQLWIMPRTLTPMFSFLFQLIFDFLCSCHYNLSLTKNNLSSYNAYFILLTMLVHSFSTGVSHYEFSTCYHAWLEKHSLFLWHIAASAPLCR
jgi:hypothetical protein